MNKKTLYALALLIASQAANAQDNVLKNTNVSELLRMEQELRTDYVSKQERVKKYAEEKGVLIHHYMPNGKVVSLVDVDPFNQPVYRTTHNARASATISTNKLYPVAGAASAYNLTGRGFQVGEWDGGTNRLTHREYQGRAVQADNGTMALSEHATHVGGTMIAGGAFSPGVKGMAYQAKLLAHDWEADDIEMTSKAAQGLLVSNHSYGTQCGWEFNESSNSWEWLGDNAVHPTYDYKFGFYNNDARVWDRIAFNAPHYLIVKSAGNSRNSGPGNNAQHPDNGPYDCIPTYSVAKNILTVGAVNPVNGGYSNPAGVVISSFSSWGPADDGRIKPDVVGNGVGVQSLGIGNDNQLVTLDGTSMSSPSVAGSCLLLQEMYSNTHYRKKMLSATLKGLVIHTADECWTAPGPDYRFGFGLMNTRKAANLIAKDSITSRLIEETLNNTQIKEYSFTAKGGEALVATLCWTDHAGTPGPAAYNSRLKMLVNDLDLRVKGPGVTGDSLPWRLNPDSAAFAARRGDNQVDNVEKIEINTPSAGGTYTIRVSHKNNLYTATGIPQVQNYSLIVSGIVTGDTNKTCLPQQYFNAQTGRFDDGSGASKNYFNGANCSWVINPEDSAAIVAVVFRSMGIDPSDTLYLHSGTDASAPLIGKYNGNALPDTAFSSSAQVFVRFQTDGSTNGPGWELEYSAIRKPKFDITGTSKTICAGDNAIFSVVNQDTQTQGWTYAWTLPGTASGTATGPTVNPVYTTEGVYPVTLTVTNRFGPATLTKTDFITVKPAVASNQTPYFQGIESTTFPVDQTNPNLNWSLAADANPWVRNTAAPFAGAAAIRIRNNTGLKNVRELISPSFDISNVPQALRGLSFMVAFARTTTAAAVDQLRVLYSTDCGKNWVEGYKKSNTTANKLYTTTDIETTSFFPEVSQYRKDTVVLSSLPANVSNFIFKFEMTSERGNFLYLDNILLNPAFTSIENLIGSSKLDMLIKPNPSMGSTSVMIKSPKALPVQVQLTDVMGKIIGLHTISDFDSGNMATIETATHFGTPPSGIYFIRVQTGEERKVLRWIVN